MDIEMRIDMGVRGEDGTGIDLLKLQEVSAQKLYRNALMLPEYLSEIPVDFAENWICVPLPIGRRCTIVSRCGITEARDINGELLESFESSLPNGSPCMDNPSRYFCLLDCIQCNAARDSAEYEEPTVYYYVLDMMVWNGIFFYNCSTESRFWLRDSKLEELGETLETRACGRRFANLPSFRCNRKGVSEAINADVGCPLRGVLFYHAEVEYWPYETPFMCGLPIDKARELMCSLPT
ncbi:snurportin-1-like [Schistocerca gregaria]|uniref:snurportin-1-like n=1 Tax=Schistocerca gregaria TaxID=7010 RepID=UPI00211E5FBA|nr:snurportin-1-like [Schistocerca gregaria]